MRRQGQDLLPKMTEPAPPPLIEQLNALREWWQGAGVDYAFTDEPHEWQAKEAGGAAADSADAVGQAAAEVPPPPPPPALGGDPRNWPRQFDQFAQWWLNEPSLDVGGARPRIPPRGAKVAQLMILVPQPEADDTETLLSGPQGRLLASFLGAAGIAEDKVYVAAGLPRYMALADYPALGAAGLSAITLHHIGLAAPERLLVFGRDILPLIGHDPAQNPASLEKIYHQDRSIPLLVARNLEMMLQRPATRSQFWQRWLDWTG